jgi:hypothetical protein
MSYPYFTFSMKIILVAKASVSQGILSDNVADPNKNLTPATATV